MSVEGLARLFGVSNGGLGVLTIGVLILAGATAVRRRSLRRRADEEAARAWRSVSTWWVLFLLLLLVLALGRAGVLFAMMVASLLLLRETLRLVGAGSLLPVAGALSLGLYVWAWYDAETVFVRALPVAVAVLALLEVALRFGIRRRFTAPPRVLYPVALSVIGPAYAFGTATLDAPAHLPGSPMGWFLLLAILTELNDMAQAWWGRALGSRPMTPVLSPHKTWEGLVGGVVTSSMAALILCPTLTSWGRAHPPGLELPIPPWIWSVALGIAVGLAGVAGDLSASALKRRAGVKDSGTMLPGQGGLLDRLDSLAATAPVFFALTYVLWSPVS